MIGADEGAWVPGKFGNRRVDLRPFEILGTEDIALPRYSRLRRQNVAARHVTHSDDVAAARVGYPKRIAQIGDHDRVTGTQSRAVWPDAHCRTDRDELYAELGSAAEGAELLL